MREFELIDYIKKKFKGHAKNRNLILPIGDDCSIIKPPKDYLQVTTVDSLVDGNHFTSRYFTPQEIGRKVLRVNLSDLASMGAVPPYYAWLTFALPQDINEKLIFGILDGVRDDCKKYDVTLAGGNITSSNEFSIHLTITGWVKKSFALSRSGAKVGDTIFVSGTIGASSLAYQQFKQGLKPQDFLLKRWANPSPKNELGIFLSKKQIANSCIDISDGIFQDMAHISSESGTGAVLRWESLPIEPELKKLNPTPHMIGFGEDYELLFTVPKSKIKLLKPFASKITEIGKVVEKGFKVLDENDMEISVGGIGYSHLT